MLIRAHATVNWELATLITERVECVTPDPPNPASGLAPQSDSNPADAGPNQAGGHRSVTLSMCGTQQDAEGQTVNRSKSRSGSKLFQKWFYYRYLLKLGKFAIRLISLCTQHKIKRI